MGVARAMVGVLVGALLIGSLAACGEDEGSTGGPGGAGGSGASSTGVAGSGATGLQGGGGGHAGQGGVGADAGNGGSGAHNPPPASCDEGTSDPQPVAAPVLRTTFEGSWDENWYGSPAVYDLDDDGDYEIIAGRHSVLYVHDADGTLLWRAAWGQDGVQQEVHGSHRTYPSVVVGDFDGDGDGEIAGVASSHAYVYSHSGEVIRQWQFGANELRSLTVANIDRSGPMEIIVQSTSHNDVGAVFDYDGGLRSGWPTGGCGGFNQNVGAGDLVGDGDLEVFTTFDCCNFSVVHQDGSPVPVHSSYSGDYFHDVPLFHDLALAQQGWGADGNDRDELTDSPPVIVDIDDDGANEIVLVSDHELAGEYVNRGNSFWVFESDMQRTAGWEQPKTTGMPLFTGYQNNIVQVAPSPAVADLDGVPGLEIVVPSYDGTMYAYSSTGSVLFTYTFDDGGGPFIGASEPLIVDLNGDGSPEILFNTYSVADDVSHMVILSAGGNTLHTIALSGRGNMAPPTVFDIDDDGDLEIIQSLKDALGGGQGGIQVWDVAGSYTNCMLWPTGRANFLRTGAPSYQ